MEALIEAVTPDTREQLNEILTALRNDREKSWHLQPDGRYIREEGGEGTSSQEALYTYFSTYRVSLADPLPPAPVREEADTAPRKSAFGWLSRLFGKQR